MLRLENGRDEGSMRHVFIRVLRVSAVHLARLRWMEFNASGPRRSVRGQVTGGRQQVAQHALNLVHFFSKPHDANFLDSFFDSVRSTSQAIS